MVPLLPSVPMELNHSAPLLMIGGTFAHVSTLFKHDGLSFIPLTAVWIYLLGFAYFPFYSVHKIGILSPWLTTISIIGFVTIVSILVKKRRA